MITIDFSAKQGAIKPLHGTGQPPFGGAFRCLDFTAFRYLTEAGIPYSRLHDVSGDFGGMCFVDIPNIFRNFDADETDPASYDFAFTDLLMRALHDYKIAPVFRLGVTIENQASIKAYRIFPPKDFDKWARVCEHIIRHYNQGWANGFHFGVVYWEIWNEPDNNENPRLNQMWQGTPEEYYRLYTTTAKHLKQCFGDTVKIGGYGACRFCDEKDADAGRENAFRLAFFRGFLDQVTKEKAPLDFFSFHSYKDADETVRSARFIKRALCEAGFASTELHLNEWNNAHSTDFLGSSYASAHAAAMMLAVQNAPVDLACYYDARMGIGDYAGLFHPIQRKPTAAFYAFKAFDRLYRLGVQVKCDAAGDGLFAVAATDETSAKKAVLIANTGAPKKEDLSALAGFDAYLLEKDVFLEKKDVTPSDFSLAENQVWLFCSDMM